MDEDGHVRLTDFGMAKVIKNNEIAWSFVGTLIIFINIIKFNKILINVK
jgi:hypothetical protein